MIEPNQKDRKRGFALLDADQRREMARRGGRSVPKDRRAFSKSQDLATEAGRKGGLPPHANGWKARKKSLQNSQEAAGSLSGG